MTNKNQVAVQEKTIVDNVLNRVNEMQNEGSLDIPDNYSPSNALKSAYLKLIDGKKGQTLLDKCTPNSISTALLEMVTLGLNPSKNQCYLIPYVDKLELVESYLGTVTRLKRVEGINDVKAHAVYKNDVLDREMDLTTGDMKIVKFTPSVNDRGELIGALGLVVGDKGVLHTEYMDMDQVKKAWNQGAMKGNSPAHKNFPDQMAMKTVINRACKMYANTSDDSDIFSNNINRTTLEVKEEIEKNGNKEVLDFADDEVIEIEDELHEYENIDKETGEILDVNSDVEEIDF